MKCATPNIPVCICPMSFGLALGITTGIVALFLGWSGWLFDVGTALVNLSASIHYGYKASFVGGIIGGMWALVEGIILGIIFGYVYNFFMCICHKNIKT